MSGSFNQRRVAEIIRASQSDWREGYELGKKRQGAGRRNLEQCSLAFRDGYYRGYNESLGKKLPEMKPAPQRMSPEEETQAQRERARYLAKHDPDIPESVLAKCHPAFRDEYSKRLRLEEEALEFHMYKEDQWNDDGPTESYTSDDLEYWNKEY